MTVTIATLRAAHREFADTANPTDAEVQAAIDRADRCYDTVALDTLYDDAVELKACQLLALSPFARDLRLAKDEHATVYDAPLRRIIESAGRTDRVIP